MSAAQDFARAMRDAGVNPPDEIVADGQIHRFPTNGRRGDDAGWYVLHADGVPAGAFGDWRSGTSTTWHASLGRRLTPEEEAERNRRIEEARRQAEEERQRRAAQTAALAAAIWKEARPAGADHPYLKLKGIAPTETLRESNAAELAQRLGYEPQAKGELLQGRVLIAPVRVGGKLATVEFIDEAGRKSALAGGTKKAGFWATGPLPARGRVVIVEGVATALSVAEALGEAAAAALSVSNLRAAGEAIRKARPGVELIIGADLDRATGKPHSEAIKAAQALGCKLAAPDFGPDRLQEHTDFNDLHQMRGLDEVRRCIKAAHEVPPEEPANAVRLVRAVDVRPEPVSWLWQGWLARGKMHLLAGRPGTGKTTLGLAFAAVVSRGGIWPDRSSCQQAGDVLIWSGEDDPADVLTPRLMAAGADLRRVHFIDGVHDAGGRLRPFDPALDALMLIERVAALRPALLLLDPLVAAVSCDSHKNAEVRRALGPLYELAARMRCAMIGVTHLVKGTQGRDPTERVIGSVAFGAAARVVMLTVRHENPGPEDPPRILLRSKSNLGRDDGGVGYDLEQIEVAPGVWASRVRWCGVIEGSARALLDKAEVRPENEGDSELDDAMGFLRGLLASGPVPTRTIRAEADGAGLSWATVRRAQKALGIEAARTGGLGKAGSWWWRLPTKMLNDHLRCSLQKDEHLSQNLSTLDAQSQEADRGKPPIGAQNLHRCSTQNDEHLWENLSTLGAQSPEADRGKPAADPDEAEAVL